MSKFLKILKVALSDPKYGYYTPKGEESKYSPKGCYGNEDCLRQWWDKERKDFF